MKRSNRLILLIGVFLAALAFVFVVILLGGGSGGGPGPGATATPPAELDTVVAARDIPLGVTVTAAMVTTQKILVPDREVGALGSPSQAIGKVARATVTKGQQVTTAVFVSQSSPTSIECLAGFTCMAVQVDQVSGVGTLIRTGDYVDVVAQISPTFPINYFIEPGVEQPTTALVDPTSVKVLMQGLQVVATLLPPPPAAEAGAPTPAPDSGGTSLNGQQEIVILAVTPQQAEVLKFAQVDGNITLTLRSPKDFVDEQGNPIIPETITTTGTVLTTMIRDFGVLPPDFVIVPAPAPLP
ncbi:MAG TPA: Flp pilus assembly protein CpaB [Candidatus Limnocylindrales bacterium]|nr:Flp pilus assembly protein CpaB [Candidatus Limnocylindrales bacterium]